MNQDVRSGGTFVETRWPFEADQALQAFEAEFDAPSQTVEVEDLFRREVLGRKGGQQNDPVGGLEGSFGNLITFPLSIPSGLAPCFCGGLFWPPAAWRGNRLVRHFRHTSAPLSICRAPARRRQP